MSASPESFAVYLESGQKRTVAGVLDWPGWCRVGRDEDAALAALADYQPRYAHILRETEHAAALAVPAPTFTIAERLAGNATTNFGVPGQSPARDAEPFDAAAVVAATDAELRRGPRGGGRDLDGVVWHTLRAERSYLARRGRKIGAVPDDDPIEAAALIRRGVRDALAAAVRGEAPERGPRGGVIWPARYFVRRIAWHVLDHLWEIEDRVIG